ncbi:MAG TPA: hypothetical protein DD725_08265 [Deltaproteobacteria bacterium]|nr:hypothetical protein [Deltaproteobacteria bacterium]
MKKTKADELRERAKELMQKAAKFEERKNLELGKLVRKYHSINFKNFDLAAFKTEVSTILES